MDDGDSAGARPHDGPAGWSGWPQDPVPGLQGPWWPAEPPGPSPEAPWQPEGSWHLGPGSLLGTAFDPPPPAREQLPLPRRRRQAHLEPRLRTPRDRGDGTPFAAFTAPDPSIEATTPLPERPASRRPPPEDARGAAEPPAPAAPPAGPVARAAAFRAAARQGRRSLHADRPIPPCT